MKRLATLTKRQDKIYGDEFGHYMNNVRHDTKRADRYAWRSLCQMWPKLREYDGAKP